MKGYRRKFLIVKEEGSGAPSEAPAKHLRCLTSASRGRRLGCHSKLSQLVTVAVDSIWSGPLGRSQPR